MDFPRAQLLQKYDVSPDARLGGGMEAEAYALDSHRVLKLYPGTTSLSHLKTLKTFYESLERQHLPYELPYIYDVIQEGDTIVTVERRLNGERLEDRLPGLDARQLEQVMERYLTAVCALSAIKASPSTERYLLFDAEGIGQRADGDWHHFLDRYLALKLAQLTPYLSRDVAQFASKIGQLRAILAQPYDGELSLLHGDFYPGNLFVNDALEINALFDFGLMTMYGDALYDVATSWVFFDMYDSLKADLRGRYLEVILARLGEQVRGKLYRYVLLYSILGANAYSLECADGHYLWCVANLNHQHYWDYIE